MNLVKRVQHNLSMTSEVKASGCFKIQDMDRRVKPDPVIKQPLSENRYEVVTISIL